MKLTQMKEEDTEKGKKFTPQQLLKWGSVGFAVSAVLIVFLPVLVTRWSWISLRVSSANEIGDTIGGILGPSVGLVAAALTFLAFWAQYDANIEQRRQFEKSLGATNDGLVKQQVESRFFELLNIHIENRNRILNSVSFNDLLDELHIVIFSLDNLKSTPSSNLTDNDKQNLGYLIFFYGTFKSQLGNGNYGYQIVDRIFRKYFNSSQTGRYFEAISRKMETSVSTLQEKFRGHQDLLSPYYRHLFQTVKYINEQPETLFSFADKYEYVKILRAQLSISEQTLLFHNAVSELGKAWEKEENLNDNHKLITKYNFIKNIPVDVVLYPKNVRETFPDVFFESDIMKTENRIKMEKTYT